MTSLLGRCRGRAGVAKAPEIDQWSDGGVARAVGLLCADAIGLFHQFGPQVWGGTASRAVEELRPRRASCRKTAAGGHPRVDVVQALL